MKQLHELIRLILEQEFHTKDNQPIEFKVYEQSPRKGDDLGRGWIVHLIEAYVDGEKAGYIAISYIPKERFVKEYPSVVQYIDKITGTSLYPGREYGYKLHWSDHFDELPLSAQVRALSHPLDVNMFSSYRGNVVQPEEMSKDELKKLKKELIKKLESRYGKRFEEFKDFHMDKPLVDFIRVSEDFQRNRIGVALYEKAARWLANKGLKLYASGIQSEEAQKAWEWLRANKGANIGTEKHGDRVRTYLSYL